MEIILFAECSVNKPPTYAELRQRKAKALLHVVEFVITYKTSCLTKYLIVLVALLQCSLVGQSQNCSVEL